MPDNLPEKFDTDPDELKPMSAYKQLNVAEQIKKIVDSSNSIVKELAKVNIDPKVLELPIVNTLLDIETFTLSALHKQIVYHTHMIDSMMIRADENGDVDVGMFFQISELCSRSTDLMTKFTIFIRTLPQHMQRLNNDLIGTIEFEDDDDDGIGYAAGAAGDEALIAKLDQMIENVQKSHRDILDTDLEANLDFDPNKLDDHGDITDVDFEETDDSEQDKGKLSAEKIVNTIKSNTPTPERKPPIAPIPNRNSQDPDDY